jgi:hypothetical protein
MGEGFRLLPGRRAGEPRSRWIPFWALQVLEVVVALVFVDVSVHVHDPGLLLGAAVLFCLLALTADGPLGIFRICHRPLHRALVVGTAGVLALAPIIPAFRPDIEGIIVLEFGMVGIIRVATLTRITDAPGDGPTTWGRRSAVVDATATVVDATGGPGPARTAPTSTQSTASDEEAGPVRRAGRVTGSAYASGKKAAARYGPEAEAQLRHTIRQAGRLAGKLTRPSQGSDRPN